MMGIECTENNLKSMGIKRLRKQAEDRSAWAARTVHANEVEGSIHIPSLD